MQNSIINKHATYRHSGTNNMKSRGIIVYHLILRYILSANACYFPWPGSEGVKEQKWIVINQEYYIIKISFVPSAAYHSSYVLALILKKFNVLCFTQLVVSFTMQSHMYHDWSALIWPDGVVGWESLKRKVWVCCYTYVWMSVDHMIVIVKDMTKDQGVRSESGRPNDKGNMLTVQGVANTIHPSIQVTIDCPSKHTDVKMPVLDLNVWPAQRQSQGSCMSITATMWQWRRRWMRGRPSPWRPNEWYTGRRFWEYWGTAAVARMQFWKNSWCRLWSQNVVLSTEWRMTKRVDWFSEGDMNR